MIENLLPELREMQENEGRKFLGVMFECCNIYRRIYVNKEGTAYEGRCPICYRQVKIKIGEGGTSSRFFKAE